MNFKANRKMIQSIKVSNITLKKFDRVLLDKHSVVRVVNGLKPLIERTEINKQEYELIVRSSLQLESDTYNRSKASKEIISLPPVNREYKLKVLKQQQLIDKTPKKKNRDKNYENTAKPYLDLIREKKT